MGEILHVLDDYDQSGVGCALQKDGMFIWKQFFQPYQIKIHGSLKYIDWKEYKKIKKEIKDFHADIFGYGTDYLRLGMLDLM